MTKKGIIIATDGKSATVEELKNPCCLDCVANGLHKNCLKCKKRIQDDTERCIATNAVGAAEGDIVEYSKNTMANIRNSLLIFVMPVLLTLVSYVSINWITSNDQLSAQISLAVLVLSMICAGIYSYRTTNQLCEYKIINII